MRSLILLLLLVTIWAGVTSIHPLVDPVILPSPVAVIRAGKSLFMGRDFLLDIGVTLRRTSIALLISVTLGLPLGLFLGYRRTWYRSFEGLIHALRSIPVTALFPLLLIVIGVGEQSIITVAAYPGVLIILVNAATGAMLADPSRFRQGRVLGMSSWQLVTQILFFEALPSVMGSVRTVVSYALVLVIAIEMFVGVGREGLGRRIFDLQSSYLIPEAYAAIAVTGALGIALNLLLNRIERYFLRWRPEAGKDLEQ
jgi:ABC-type nitrate/sulfonate/bicarbonate transport system permease component